MQQLAGYAGQDYEQLLNTAFEIINKKAGEKMKMLLTLPQIGIPHSVLSKKKESKDLTFEQLVRRYSTVVEKES